MPTDGTILPYDLVEGQLVPIIATVVFCPTDSPAENESDNFCAKINHQIIHAIPKNVVANGIPKETIQAKGRIEVTDAMVERASQEFTLSAFTGTIEMLTAVRKMLKAALNG